MPLALRWTHNTLRRPEEPLARKSPGGKRRDTFPSIDAGLNLLTKSHGPTQLQQGLLRWDNLQIISDQLKPR